MSDSKEVEYQQVAALLSFDINLFYETAKNNPDIAFGLLEKLEERRLEAIKDPEYRQSRYQSIGALSLLIANTGHTAK